jgi:hypothetical protein
VSARASIRIRCMGARKPLALASRAGAARGARRFRRLRPLPLAFRRAARAPIAAARPMPPLPAAVLPPPRFSIVVNLFETAIARTTTLERSLALRIETRQLAFSHTLVRLRERLLAILGPASAPRHAGSAASAPPSLARAASTPSAAPRAAATLPARTIFRSVSIAAARWPSAAATLPARVVSALAFSHQPRAGNERPVAAAPSIRALALPALFAPRGGRAAARTSAGAIDPAVRRIARPWRDLVWQTRPQRDQTAGPGDGPRANRAPAGPWTGAGVALAYRNPKTTPVAAPAPPAHPPVERPPPPPLDVERLSRDVWRQLEKRMRIERERHGRL